MNNKIRDPYLSNYQRQQNIYFDFTMSVLNVNLKFETLKEIKIDQPLMNVI